MIEPFKRVVRRHWPRLRLRTILLLTFVFVAALPGVGALFLRVYENALVRQTEAELVAQGAALAAAAAADRPDALPFARGVTLAPEPPGLDLRFATVLPDRPAARRIAGASDPVDAAWARRFAPVIGQTVRTTLASVLLLDSGGRILTGRHAGASLADLPEVRSALAGRPATVLRRNDAYRPAHALEWISRAADLGIHHARPVMAGDRAVGVLLLARPPRALFVGMFEDRGKIAVGVVAIFAALVLLSGLLSRGIVRPVEALGEATRAVAEGRGEVPDPPTTAAIEIQALYRDFAVMAAAIGHRSRYLRDFAHAVSHEFKTPLAAIGGAVELLQDHPDMAPADRERFLGNMAADAARLTLLVSRLLDLARADMTQAAGDERTDIADVLRRLADAWQGDRFAVRIDAAATIPAVAAPPAMLEAALTGLLDNSRQAGATTAHITARRDDGHVVLTVADDGPGIPPGDRDRVFEPFFTSRRGSGGTGLGLPITRSLLLAHGGTIDRIDSERGAVFCLTLPVWRVSEDRVRPG